MTKIFACLLVAAAVFASESSRATLIYGTGQGSSPGSLDSNWQIVAVPGSWTAPSSLPYNAYVIPSAPGVFIGGGNPQTGVTFNSVTNYWIAPHNSDASLVGGNYNWIVAQNFIVDQAGVYTFSFQGAGDNELDFYINGSVGNFLGDSNRPTIVGGTQIGTRAGGFSYLTTFTGNAYMNAGTNTAYMVLWDYGGSTGALIQQSSFSVVPEPGTWAAAALLVGGAAFVRWRKRAKVS
jgi:hypothetical protein